MDFLRKLGFDSPFTSLVEGGQPLSVGIERQLRSFTALQISLYVAMPHLLYRLAFPFAIFILDFLFIYTLCQVKDRCIISFQGAGGESSSRAMQQR